MAKNKAYAASSEERGGKETTDEEALALSCLLSKTVSYESESVTYTRQMRLYYVEPVLPYSFCLA